MTTNTALAPALTIDRHATGVTFRAPGVYHRVWEPRPGVVLQVQEGRAPLESAIATIALLDQALARTGRLFIAVDAERLIAYDRGVRETFIQWMKTHRAELVGTHMLVRSSILRMAMQLMNVILNGVVTVHTDRATFEVAIEQYAGPSAFRLQTQHV